MANERQLLRDIATKVGGEKREGILEALLELEEIDKMERELSSLRSDAGSMCYNWGDEWTDLRRKIYDENKQDTARLQAALDVRINSWKQ